MVEAGIDELTIILLPSDEMIKNNNHRWKDIASEMFFEVEKRLNLIDLFGERRLMNKAISGYTVGYSYGNHRFFFAVCYHHLYAIMGVIVKFSAQALAFYQEQRNMYVYEILQQLQSPLYQVRCSRIDIAVDYINEDLSVNEIRDQYINKDLRILVMRERNGQLEQVIKNYSLRGISEGSEYQTIYFGNRDSPAMLRIYDKKIEQINNKKSSRRSEAEGYDNWIRFELEVKKYYAHDLTEVLLNIDNQTDYKEMILGFFIQKFYFAIIKENRFIPTPYMQKIIDMKNDKSIILFKSLNTKNTELQRSFLYLLKSSGVITTLYKIKTIWGDKALNDSIKIIIDYINNNEYKPNTDCIYFLRNYGKEYKTLYADFNEYFDNEVKPKLDEDN